MNYTLFLITVLLTLFAWMHGYKTRFRHWKETRRADRLEKELTVLQAKNGTSS